MKMMRTLLPAVACLGLLLSGCKKEPGEGGKSELRGYVYERLYNDGTCQPIGEAYPLIDARVYIIYGDHDFYDDDVRTGPDGLFVFNWLREGDYKVYAVTECDNSCDEGCSGDLKAVYASANLSGKDEVVNVGTLNVRNY